MIEHAENMGANAVVDVRITTSAVMAGTSEILAYGTAVILEDELLLNELILYLSVAAILLSINFLSQLWALLDLKKNPFLDDRSKKRLSYMLLLGLPGVVLYIMKWKNQSNE